MQANSLMCCTVARLCSWGRLVPAATAAGRAAR